MGSRRIAITGGAGYVGSELVPVLIDRGYDVTVIDLFLYGDDVFAGMRDSSQVRRVKASR